MLDPGDGLRLPRKPVNLRLASVGEYDAHIPALAVLHLDRLERHFGLGIRHYRIMAREQPERHNEFSPPYPNRPIGQAAANKLNGLAYNLG